MTITIDQQIEWIENWLLHRDAEYGIGVYPTRKAWRSAETISAILATLEAAKANEAKLKAADEVAKMLRTVLDSVADCHDCWTLGLQGDPDPAEAAIDAWKAAGGEV